MKRLVLAGDFNRQMLNDNSIRSIRNRFYIGVSFRKNSKEREMSREQLINNSRLLTNLDTHLNEDQLSSSIAQLSSEVNKIESVSGRSLHTIKIRSEITKLEDKLAYTRNQANLRTQQFHETKSED